jgi:type VI secretion system protein ImpK
MSETSGDIRESRASSSRPSHRDSSHASAREPRESSRGSKEPKDARKAVTRSGKLTDAAGPLLSLIIVLRRTTNLDDLKDLRGTVDRMILEFRSRTRDEAVSAVDIDDATYAIAATFDETLLNARWNGRDAWEKNALARTYCNDEFVGLGFFDKLAQLRRSSNPPRDVIEIFYYCLVAGFQGKLVENPRQLADLVDELSKEIGTSNKVLAPNGAPEKAGGLEPMRRFPWILVALTAIFLPLLFWLVAWNVIDRHADNIRRAFAGN